MKNEHHPRYEPPDGGWGWVVAIAASINVGLTWGLHKSYGIFMIDIMDSLGTDAKLTGGAGGLCSAMGSVLGPAVAVMMRKFGIRWVCLAGGILGGTGFACGYFAHTLPMIYFSYSILYGAASSLISMCSFGVINVYFRKRHSFAMGITMAGVGISTVISSQVINVLVHEYTYRGAFLITGAIVLHSVPCALTFMPLTKTKKVSKTRSVSFLKKEEHSGYVNMAVLERSNLDLLKAIQNDTQTETSGSSHSNQEKRIHFHWDIFKDVRFWIFTVCMSFLDVSYMSATVYLPFKSLELMPGGVNEATMVSIFSLVDSFGQVIFGLLWDYGRFQDIYQRMIGYTLFSVIAGCAVITFSAIHSYTVLYFWVSLTGLLFGAMLSPTFIMIKNMVGEERYTDFLSADLLLETPGLFLGPLLIGYIYDNSGDTGAVFITMGIFLVLSGLIAIALPILTKIWYEPVIPADSIPSEELTEIDEHHSIQTESHLYMVTKL